MALSKPLASEAAELLGATRRVAVPLAELAGDACAGLASWFGAPSATPAGGPRPQGDDEGRSEKKDTCLLFLEHLFGGAAPSDGNSSSPSSCDSPTPWGIVQALQELEEDLPGTTSTPILLGATLAIGPSIGPVIISGLSISTKALFAFESLALGIAAYVQLHRCRDQRDHTMQQRACISLSTSSAMCMVLAVLGDALPPMPYLLPHPEVFMHCLVDIIAMPPLLLNLAYLAGVPASSMRNTLLFMVGSSAAAAAAAVTASKGGCLMVLLGADMVLLGQVVRGLQGLPLQAMWLSVQNQHRVEVSMGLMVLALGLYPLFQALGAVGMLSDEQVMQAFALLDMTGKFGASHMMFRDRFAIHFATQRAIRAARTFIYQVPRERLSLNAHTVREPCSEPSLDDAGGGEPPPDDAASGEERLAA